MGLFFEVVVVGAVTWWMGESAFRAWLERRSVRSAIGSHDAGVQVDEVMWAQIVAELEGESDNGDRGRGPQRLE